MFQTSKFILQLQLMYAHRCAEQTDYKKSKQTNNSLFLIFFRIRNKIVHIITHQDKSELLPDIS